MQSGKEKMSNMASAAKEKAEVYKAKAEEKVEKMTTSTEEEKRIAEEKRRAKEAEAKMKLHESKAEHAADKLATAGPATGAPIGTGVPAYPLGGYSTRNCPSQLVSVGSLVMHAVMLLYSI